MTKHQIRSGNGRWAGRSGVGRLNPRGDTKIKGKNGVRKRRRIEEKKRRKFFILVARKTAAARQSRAERRLVRQSATRNRAHARTLTVITVVTRIVRTMAVDGAHGVGQAIDVFSVNDRIGCDTIGLQETCRSGYSPSTQAGYLVYSTVLYCTLLYCTLLYCSGECGGENEGIIVKS